MSGIAGKARVGGGFAFCYSEAMKPGESLFLIGPRASGKTSVARIVASRLDMAHMDTDEMLTAKLGKSIAEVVAEEGWEAFRKLESKVLAEASGPGNRVIATGGGIVLEQENVALLRKRGPVVYLRADAETLARRLAADPNEAQRPSLTGGGLIEEVAQVLAEREPLYLDCADHIVQSAGGPEAAADEIISLIGQGRES